MVAEDEHNAAGEQAGREEERREEKIIPFSSTGEGEPAEESGETAARPEEPAAGEHELTPIIEALLFASDRLLDSGELAELSGAEDGHQVRRLVQSLQQQYEAEGRAFCIEEVAGGFRMVTRPDYHHWVGRLKESDRRETLSQAAMETLAIVAYRQPITRAEVEDIRGVQSNYILRSLIEKDLVRVAGKSDELGRPLLYGTTRRFLEVFGLGSLEELPEMEELSQE